MRIHQFLRTAGAAAILGLAATSAHASLTSFQTFTGNIGFSSDGAGFTSSSGSIQASVPVGATVLAAYLYTSANSTGPQTGSLGGTAVNYTQLGINNGFLQASRADVTSIVAPIINGGVGGTYNFTVTEGNTGVQDGEALVVVYSLASLPVSTFGILDGFSSSAGDATAINFSAGLDPTAAGFHAEMIIGDGFSFNNGDTANQSSTITVNGTTITTTAGNFDDGAAANGALITVGGFDDPFSPLLPDVLSDHERYNLIPQIHVGDTSIAITTRNPSGDDNIFLAGFFVTGLAGVNAPPPDTTPTIPEPGSLALGALGALALALGRRRKSVR